MDSADSLSSPDVELSPPVLVTYDTVVDVTPRFETEVVNNRDELWAHASFLELRLNCVGLAFVLCLCVSFLVIERVYGPRNVWLGPNSSVLVEPSSFFVQSVKAKELQYSRSGLQLFGFYRSPALDVVVNWSESRLLSVSQSSYKEWPYYLNKGTSLNISYSVKPEGSDVQLVVYEGKEGVSQWLLDELAFRDIACSWNLTQGSGKIDLEISKSSGYFLAVGNWKREDVEVELKIDVSTALYNTEHSLYNCTISNDECTFNAMYFVGTSVVVTSPAPSQGASTEDEWYIRISYEPRWITFIIATGMVMCFTLAAMHFWYTLLCCTGERYPNESDSARAHLLEDKDDDSCNESFTNDDADLEDFLGCGGETSNSSRRLCTLCYDAPRDCFFLPCSHCISCNQCGTMMAEARESCPVCRREIRKVKQIFTV